MMRSAAKIFISRIVLILLVSLSAGCAAAKAPFVHPGTLNSDHNLDFVKTQVAQGRSPWSDAFREVEVLAIAGAPVMEHVNSRDDTEADAAKRSAVNAYANALAWRLTGKPAYARQAIETLNRWSGFKGFTGGTDQDKLLAGWLGPLLGEAAEIMRGHRDWRPQQIASLQAMFRTQFYPQLTTASQWNGNVDLTQINALMTLSVFNDDRTAFMLAMQRLERRSAAYFYLTSDKAVPSIEGDGGDIAAFWSHPASWVDGLTQESCRDNGHHAQFALASALNSAEIAWNQGEDVYGRQSKRYTAAMELLARQLLTGDMQSTCKEAAATKRVYSTFEVGFNHYHNRMGMALPWTRRLIAERVRPYGVSDWNIFHETLTHAGPMVTVTGAISPKLFAPSLATSRMVCSRMRNSLLASPSCGSPDWKHGLGTQAVKHWM